jgi:hypothetical protein
MYEETELAAISILYNEREYKSEVEQLNQFLLWKQLKIMKNSILCHSYGDK